MTRPRIPELSSGAAFFIGAVLLISSTAVRLISYPVQTSDYIYFLAKWFDALSSHPGLTAFQSPFSDYAPLYLYLLKMLTYLPVYSLWSVKSLSVLFDIGMAYLVYRILRSTTEYSRGVLFLCAAIMFSVPTIVLNSALWGQSDALYAFGILGALYAMLLERPRWAALSFALAFAFKVQSVFFLPVLVGYFWPRKSAWKELLWIPAVYALTIVPAWLGGGNFFHLLTIYGRQSGEYAYLNVSSPSIFAFTDGLSIPAGVQNILFWAGLAASALAALGVAYMVSRMPSRPKPLLFWSLVCVIAVPYLLPRMHERYFYLADVLSVLFALYAPRRWFVPVLVAGASLLAYMPFLSSQVGFFSGLDVDLRIPSLMLVAALAALFALKFASMRKGDAVSYGHAHDISRKGKGSRGNDALPI